MDVDFEDIKFVYWRLLKEYYLDIILLLFKIVLDKFMKLREVYDVLSDEESRRFYDWILV